MVEDAILEKIQKLLNLQKSTNEHEAALAATKAQELLFKYNLEITDIEAHIPEESKEPISHVYQQIFERNQISWKIDLASGVARANLCKLLLSGSRVIWIGTKTNTEIASYLYEVLQRDLEDISEKQWQQILSIRKMEIDNEVALFTDRYLRRVHGKTWKNSFLLGAANTINKRLIDNLDQIKDTIDRASALIVLNDKSIDDYVKNAFGKISNKATSNTYIYGTAYSAGQAAGKTINLTRNGVGSGGSGGSIGPKLLKEKSHD